MSLQSGLIGGKRSPFPRNRPRCVATPSSGLAPIMRARLMKCSAANSGHISRAMSANSRNKGQNEQLTGRSACFCTVVAPGHRHHRGQKAHMRERCGSHSLMRAAKIGPNTGSMRIRL